MATDEQLFAQLCDHARQAALLVSIDSLLGWDERCLLPPAAGEYRAEQITLLTGLVHDRLTDPVYGEWLARLAASPLAVDRTSDAGATIHHLRRHFERRVKLPKRLVEELARTAVLGQQAWQQARHDDDFAVFCPLLETTVRLKREQAAAVGYEECPYDALLDEYEPGERTSRVAPVLAALRDELVPLVAAIGATGRKAPIEILHRGFPVESQQDFVRQAAAAIGFDFDRGRIDTTAHPFCTSLGPHDHRITTRYEPNYFNSGFFGTLHEAGHGIYEQRLRPEWYGLPLGEAVSMGIHESQSRMWENFVGRSRSFWEYFFPRARAEFPAALGDVTVEQFFFAINDVRPSLIRVEADEATYNLHILVRFELEQALIHDELAVADLPAAWHEKYQAALGIRAPSDANGVLQDIHWSAGLFGYFPTYSLGNLYAAQFFAQADQELGGLADLFSRGEFAALGQWLERKIHAYGQRYSAAELVQRITGKPLGHAPLVRHLRDKLTPLYRL